MSRDLHAAALAQAQAAGVDQRQAGAVAQLGDLAEDRAHLLARQHHRQLVLALRPRHARHREVPLQRRLVEELDPAQRDGDRRPRQLALALQVHEVLPDLLVGERVRAPVVVARQAFDGPRIRRTLRLLREAPQGHVLEHAPAQRRDRPPDLPQRGLVEKPDARRGVRPERVRKPPCFQARRHTRRASATRIASGGAGRTASTNPSTPRTYSRLRRLRQTLLRHLRDHLRPQRRPPRRNLLTARRPCATLRLHV